MNVPKNRIYQYFKTNISRGLEEGKKSIDRENKIIHGYAVMTKGFVKDFRGWEIDDVTLNQIVEAANGSDKGIRVGFGHPNVSSTVPSSLLGKSRNFRRDGEVVRADMYLSETAFESNPEGNLGNYVLDLAEKEPDMFGASVVLSEANLEYRLNEDGTRQKDKKGDELPPVLRVKKISSVDVVDQPAANDGFFSRQFYSESTFISAEATEFLNKFLSHPDAVEATMAFLNRYQRNRDEAGEINNLNKGGTAMGLDIKDVTVDQLKEQRPDLVADLKKESADSRETLEFAKKDSFAAGKAQERERVVNILKFSRTPEFKEYVDLAFESIEKGESFADAEKKLMGKRMKDLEEGAPKTPGPNDESTTGKLTHLQRAEQYKAQHNCSMTEALKTTAEPRKK